MAAAAPHRERRGGAELCSVTATGPENGMELSGEGRVVVRDRLCTRGRWARNGLPRAVGTARVPEFRERLGSAQTLGLNLGWCCVEPGVGLCPCGSLPTQDIL